jgi:hypothetical protein
MAEQDRLDQVLRQRAAIHRDEGPARTLALALDGARDHFLAHARFALDQHGDVGLRTPLAQTQHIGHGGRGGDDVAEGEGAAHLLVETLHLLGEGIHLQEVLDRDLEALWADRLHHEVVGPRAHRLDDGLDRTLRGLDDHRQVAAHRLEALQEFKPVHARHVQVEDDEFDRAAGLAPQNIQRPLAPIHRHGVTTESPYHFFENSALGRIVFDDENADSHAMRTSFKNRQCAGRLAVAAPGREGESPRYSGVTLPAKCKGAVNGEPRLGTPAIVCPQVIFQNARLLEAFSRLIPVIAPKRFSPQVPRLEEAH